jgi:hypothetical protein
VAAGLLFAALLAVSLPAGAGAAVTTFGSPLSVAATLNTSDNLSYQGVNTQVPPSPEFPEGVAHTAHFGSDTAIWNTYPAATAPANGQAVKIRLEGCAEPAAGGPAPLTQIHFQDLAPVAGGGAKVNLTSQPFDIPVCGQNGAGGSTVTTYEPINLCMSQGDYLAFNDEGGYVQTYYRAGVPYEVMARAPGSALDSYIGGGRTNNGDVLSPSDVAPMEGFATTASEELMLQVVFATGADATHICSGGTAGLAPALVPVNIGSQTDGVNHAHTVKVAVYCHSPSGCKGSASLEYAGRKINTATATFSLAGSHTGHIPLHLTAKTFARLRKHRSGIRATLVVIVNGQTFSKQITIKIL